MRTNNVFTILFISLYSILNSQGIGIGANVFTPDPSAMLEIQATDKGVLIPRISLNSTSDVTTISNPAVGLLIYNTAYQNDVKPGFYYWNGLKWLRLFTEEKPVWFADGNPEIDPSTHFLGTLNNKPLIFKTNNIERMRLDTNGRVGINTSHPLSTLDVNGDVRVQSIATAGDTAIVVVGSDGVLRKTTSGSKGDVLTWTGSGPTWTMPEMDVAATIIGTIAATVAKPSNTAILITPLYLPGRITVNQMRIRVTTALGAVGDVGIYDAKGNLLLNGGAGSLSTAAGVKIITPIQANRTLNPGQYYAAVTWNSTTGVIAGANLGNNGAHAMTGYINTGGGTVLPANINLSSLVTTQYLYYVSINK